MLCKKQNGEHPRVARRLRFVETKKSGEPREELAAVASREARSAHQLSVGVVQSLQSARFPVALAAAEMLPVLVPVFFRNLRMFCFNGSVHSGRCAQCVPSATAERYEMLPPAPSALNTSAPAKAD